MKKVGLIDYYLDEWHANNYPRLLHDVSEGRYEAFCAYAKIDSPIDGMTSREWSKKYNVPLVDSIEEVIEACDVLIVLSPDNPEMHEELTDLPLKSGKRVYIDKTFAPDKEAALRMFANADKHNTPCYTSSALRFADELDTIDTDSIYKIYSEGSGLYDIYAIHQIEPIVRLMQTDAKRVMFVSDIDHPSMVIEFADGRLVQMQQVLELQQQRGYEFSIITVDADNNAVEYPIRSRYFHNFMKGLIQFFDTGEIPVPHRDTVNVIAIRAAGMKAAEHPFTWIEV